MASTSQSPRLRTSQDTTTHLTDIQSGAGRSHTVTGPPPGCPRRQKLLHKTKAFQTVRAVSRRSRKPGSALNKTTISLSGTAQPQQAPKTKPSNHQQQARNLLESNEKFTGYPAPAPPSSCYFAPLTRSGSRNSAIRGQELERVPDLLLFAFCAGIRSGACGAGVWGKNPG